MSENSRFIAVISAVVLAVALTIVLVVVSRSGEDVVDPVAEETVDQPVAVSNDDVSTDVDEPEAEPAVESGEVEEVEEQEEKKPEPVKEVAPTTEAPEEVADEIEDIMAALEYREDFCPEGFQLDDMGDVGSNPGYIEGERMDYMSKEFGEGVEIQSIYLCAFSSSKPDRKRLGYYVFQLADHDNALALRETAKTRIAEKARVSGETFAIRNCVVLLAFNEELADLGDELLGKLKRAVNYKE